jgi:hypothetical protein
MLNVGQQRSNRKKTALAAEPCCDSDCKSLMEFQGHTTTPQGWPELEAKPNAMKIFDSCAVRAQSPICIGDRSAVLQNSTASEEAAIIDGKRISKEHLMKVIRESFFQNLSSLHVTEYLWQICRRVQLFSKRKWALAV